MNRAIYLPLVFFYLLVHSGFSAAHGVNVFAYQENGLIKGEASLAGERMVKGGEIQVLHKADGSLLLSTKTDDKGLFSFAVDQLGRETPVDLLIVLNAGPGHRSEWNLHVELSPRETGSSGDAESEHNPAAPPKKPAGPSTAEILAGIACILGLGGIVYLLRSRKG